MSPITLAVAGISGSVGTTLATGLAAIQRGGAPDGLLTELVEENPSRPWIV